MSGAVAAGSEGELTEAAVLARWLAACRAAPGELPPGVDTVHRRLVRVVGRGHLPGGGLAFLKVMAFPRARDLLRYSVRPIPARREATMLARIDALGLGIELPEVLAVVAERRFGLPRLSVLVTRGLPLAAGPGEGSAGLLGVEEAARVGARLAAAGVWQRDLHRHNVLRLEGGKVGLLDVQSARIFDRPLSARERCEMAVKLLSTSSPDEDPAQLVTAGLVEASRLESVVRRVRSQRRADRTRQVLRCLRASSVFRVERPEAGARVYLRRDLEPSIDRDGWAEVGRDGLALWLGDRFLEVVDGRAPSLLAMRRNAWWRRAPDKVYIRPESAPCGIEGIRSDLSEGFRRWAAFRSASEPSETSST